MKGRPPIPIAVKAQRGDTRKLGANKFQEMVEDAPKARRGRPPLCKATFQVPKDDEQAKARIRLAKEHRDYLVDTLDADGRLAESDGGMLDAQAYCYSLLVETARVGNTLEYARLHQRYMQGADRMALNESARARLPRESGESRTVEDVMFG